LARTIHIRCIYGISGRVITKYTVIYGVYIRFWPTLDMSISNNKADTLRKKQRAALKERIR
jgi:hypothetical protein